MPSDTPYDASVRSVDGALGAFDAGLLSPVTVAHDDLVSDHSVLGALVAAEVALVRAWAASAVAPPEVADDVSAALGWVAAGSGCRDHGVDLRALATDAAGGGNPVIPLVAQLKARVPASARPWVHRGATSQDILDSALMLTAYRAVATIAAHLRDVESALAAFAAAHRDDTAAARTLTQHAVPTTVGLRAAGWLRAVRRARARLEETADVLPAQLAGAGGTLASFLQIAGDGPGDGGADAASRVDALVEAYAADLGLAVPDGPWHTNRWPVTELGDALVQCLDALGKLAADVSTLARTEIAEISEAVGGGSSAMPQKQNPAATVLIRSAALRAPHLGATLHLAAALAVDERPDGAWHAEWPTLRDLLRLALGVSAHGAALVRGLVVDSDAVARNLAHTRGLIVSERLAIVLTPLVGAERVRGVIAAASDGGDLAALVRALPEAAELDVDALLDPADYTGLAGRMVDDALASRPAARTAPTEERTVPEEES